MANKKQNNASENSAELEQMQKKLDADPAAMDDCMKEMEMFLGKYPIVAKVDLANIAAL